MRFGYTADTPSIVKFIYTVMEELGYRLIKPESLTVLDEEDLKMLIKWISAARAALTDNNKSRALVIDELNHIERWLISKAHTKRELGE